MASNKVYIFARTDSMRVTSHVCNISSHVFKRLLASYVFLSLLLNFPAVAAVNNMSYTLFSCLCFVRGTLYVWKRPLVFSDVTTFGTTHVTQEVHRNTRVNASFMYVFSKFKRYLSDVYYFRAYHVIIVSQSYWVYISTRLVMGPALG